ncbi:MAG: hypothetical protein R3F07_15615 [Opitutaceae bacterium]
MDAAAGNAGEGDRSGLWYWSMITGISICLLCLTLWPSRSRPAQSGGVESVDSPVQGTIAGNTP